MLGYVKVNCSIVARCWRAVGLFVHNHTLPFDTQWSSHFYENIGSLLAVREMH